jgi:anti-sigma B factor antagonist
VTELVRVELEEQDDVVLAHVSGELDIAGAGRIGSEIGEAVPASARGLVVDLTALEFIDSSGVSMLFRLVRRLSARRQSLAVVSRPSGPVARVLEIVEFENAAPVEESVAEAVAGIRAQSA